MDILVDSRDFSQIQTDFSKFREFSADSDEFRRIQSVFDL